MSEWSWNGDSNNTDESSEPTEGGFFQKMGSWLTGKSGKQGNAGNDSFENEIEAARKRGRDYNASGKADEHRQQLGESNYRSSLDYGIASETEHLERHLSHYDDECSRFGTDAMLSQELWAKRIATLNQALADAERVAGEIKEAYENLEERRQRGVIARAEYDDQFRLIGRKEQRALTRLGIGGVGGSYEEIGDVGDQSSHILVDGLSEDDGELRQKIAKKIKSMPRRMALEIIQQAVDDKTISQEAADYLIRDCVRPS